MLKAILSISGKPGLYRLISSGKNMVIVESLVDSKKMPIYARDKVVSLEDISIYTENEDEVPLRKVLIAIDKKENGANSSIEANAKPEILREYFEEVLPSFDRDRVYPTDIKKIITWYNILKAADVELIAEVEKEESESISE